MHMKAYLSVYNSTMYIFKAIVCLLSIVHINGVKSAFFFDESMYNPCKTKLGLYFYPHPTNIHSYYQCDESGNAYIRSCGDLVWDALQIACNWPTAGLPPSPVIPTMPTSSWPTMKPPRKATPPWPTTTSPWTSTTTTTSSWPSSTDTTSTASSTTTDTTSTASSTTTDTTSTASSTTTDTTSTVSSTTTDNPPSSLCKPVNPCGAHGDCVESPLTIPDSARRFACLCSDNWFGRLCDKNIDDFTTPATMISDQNKHQTATNDTFSLPAKTEKDSKLIFYGLKAGNTVLTFNETGKGIN